MIAVTNASDTNQSTCDRFAAIDGTSRARHTVFSGAFDRRLLQKKFELDWAPKFIAITEENLLVAPNLRFSSIADAKPSNSKVDVRPTNQSESYCNKLRTQRPLTETAIGPLHLVVPFCKKRKMSLRNG